VAVFNHLTLALHPPLPKGIGFGGTGRTPCLHPPRLSRLDFGSCSIIVRHIGQNGALQSRRAGEARRSGRPLRARSERGGDTLRLSFFSMCLRTTGTTCLEKKRKSPRVSPPEQSAHHSVDALTTRDLDPGELIEDTRPAPADSQSMKLLWKDGNGTKRQPKWARWLVQSRSTCSLSPRR
jgi:hypothetical protein